MNRVLLAALAVSLLSSCAVGERRAAPDGGAPASHSAQARPAERSAPPELITLEVGGMTCQGCVARVQKQLETVPGVHRVEVTLSDQRARVLTDAGVADTALTGAVRRAGSEFLGIVVQR